MPRLIAPNGVTVSVSEETAALLGSEWVPAGVASKSDAPDKSWKVADLTAYAEENGIDLLGATKKDDILAAIDLHEPDGSDDDGDKEDSEES